MPNAEKNIVSKQQEEKQQKQQRLLLSGPAINLLNCSKSSSSKLIKSGGGGLILTKSNKPPVAGKSEKNTVVQNKENPSIESRSSDPPSTLPIVTTDSVVGSKYLSPLSSPSVSIASNLSTHSCVMTNNKTYVLSPWPKVSIDLCSNSSSAPCLASEALAGKKPGKSKGQDEQNRGQLQVSS